MPTIYLFRIDGAKDNDAFFAVMRPAARLVYAGIDLPICTAGWVPDLVRVTIEEPPDSGSLTLIELESTESAARISCRKYLPEDPASILAAFTDYLDRLISKCRSTADHRESELIRLKALLSKVNDLTVTSAGALRSSTAFVEELPLIQQPNVSSRPVPSRVVHQEITQPFHGNLRLSAHEAKALGRCVIILDAVIRQLDHSSATFHNWRNKAPLKRLLRADNGNHPALRKLVFEVFEQQNHGLTFDLEVMLAEVVEIWSPGNGPPLDRERTRNLLRDYHPIGSAIGSHDQMAAVFEAARRHVSAAYLGLHTPRN